MNSFVADTMAIVSYLGKRKLPVSVKSIFQSADLGLVKIIIPAIVLLEIGYLSEKKRIDVNLIDIQKHLAKDTTYAIQDLSFDIIIDSYKITYIPELHDRIIAGTAKYLAIPLITNDICIQASTFLNTFW